MKVSKEILCHMAYSDEGEEYKGFRLADKEFITGMGTGLDTGLAFRSVIENLATNRFYETLFWLPATEDCTVTPYGSDPAQIELKEVYPKIICHTIYDCRKYKSTKRNNKLLQISI